MWTVDGKELNKRFSAENLTMGLSVNYIMVSDDEGKARYAKMVIKQPGGVAIVPMLRKGKEILIGVLNNDEGIRVPRGFYKSLGGTSWEKPIKTAVREFAQEDEANVLLPEKRFIPLRSRVNMDDGFFELLCPEGISFFKVNSKDGEIIKMEDGRISFNPEITMNNNSSKIDFIPAKEVIESSKCGITLLGVMLATRKLI